jgi:hypothetical protein
MAIIALDGYRVALASRALAEAESWFGRISMAFRPVEFSIAGLHAASPESADAVACEPRMDLIVHLRRPGAIQRDDVRPMGRLDALPLGETCEMGRSVHDGRQ